MLDGVVVVNEVVLEANLRKRLCLVFKADFLRHTIVRWDFLYYMMRRM